MLRRCLFLGLVLILLVIVGGVVGCGGAGGSPSDVVRTYYSALNAGNFGRAEECLAPGTVLHNDHRALAGNIEKIEIIDVLYMEVFDVEVAEVAVEVTLNPACLPELGHLDGTRTLALEKRDSGWKIFYRY